MRVTPKSQILKGAAPHLKGSVPIGHESDTLYATQVGDGIVSLVM